MDCIFAMRWTDQEHGPLELADTILEALFKAPAETQPEYCVFRKKHHFSNNV